MNDDTKIEEQEVDNEGGDLFGDQGSAAFDPHALIENESHEATGLEDLPDGLREGFEEEAAGKEGEETKPDGTEEEAKPDEGAATTEETPAADELGQKAGESEPEWKARLAGKTPEEISELWWQAQQEIGRRGDQLGQLRQQLDALSQIDNEVPAQQQAPAQLGEEAFEELLNYALVNPQAAYQAAVNATEAGAASPDVVDAVLEVIGELDAGMGRALTRDFDQRQILAQVEARQRPVLEPIQQREAVNRVEQVARKVINDEAVGADALEYRAEIGQLVRSDASYFGDGSPAAIEKGMRRALREAIGADPTRSAAFKALSSQQASEQLVNEKQNAQVETRGASGGTGELVDESEAYRRDVFERNKRDPALSLLLD